MNLHGDNELTISQKHRYERIVVFAVADADGYPKCTVEAQDEWTAEPGKTFTQIELEAEDLESAT